MYVPLVVGLPGTDKAEEVKFMAAYLAYRGTKEIPHLYKHIPGIFDFWVKVMLQGGFDEVSAWPSLMGP
jgi:hypothetical protein